MTENEAILMMRYRIDTASEIAGKGTDGKAFEDMEMAIKALEEIHLYHEGKLCLIPTDVYSRQCEELDAYKEIGTVEECREGVERQKPKKPKELDTEYGYFICGNCGGAIACTDDFKSHKYCLNCGQAIYWEESEEE